MTSPWIDSPALDVDPVSSDLGLDMDRLALQKQAVLGMFDDLRSQLDITDDTLAEMIDAGTNGRFRHEAEAWAEILERTWQEVLLANCAYDAAVRVFMCSGLAMETGQGPVLARNMDWWPEELLARGSVLLRHGNATASFQLAGWLGSIGAVSGMSSRGFALAMNAVLSNDPLSISGYPVMLFLRSVLEDAQNYEHAFQMICETELASPCLVLLVGTRNEERVVVERTPKRYAFRRGKSGEPLVVTNEYRVIDEADTGTAAEGHGLYASACGRYANLLTLCESGACDPGSDHSLLHVLSDPGVQMEITAQQMVFRPSSGRSRLVSPSRFFG